LVVLALSQVKAPLVTSADLRAEFRSTESGQHACRPGADNEGRLSFPFSV